MKHIALLNLSGRDGPGITAMVTSVLAAHGGNVLDIGQAVIHEQLSLGLMVELPGRHPHAEAMRELEAGAAARGLHVLCSEISAQAYRDWVAGQGQARHIVTLLSRRLRGADIARICEVIVRHGLTISAINRLSGRVSLDESAAKDRACVEFQLRGAIEDPSAVRAELLALAFELGVDIACQEDDLFRRNRRLVAFDMDSTLIDAEVIDELARRAGVGIEVAAITARAMRGQIDFADSFRRRVALLSGLDEAVLAEVARDLRLTEGAEALMTVLKRLGLKTAIISGGFGYFARDIQRRLGFDYVFANELDIEDGRVSGRVTGPIVDGNRKAELLRDR